MIYIIHKISESKFNLLTKNMSSMIWIISNVYLNHATCLSSDIMELNFQLIFVFLVEEASIDSIYKYIFIYMFLNWFTIEIINLCVIC